jgi:hypothetical protein
VLALPLKEAAEELQALGLGKVEDIKNSKPGPKSFIFKKFNPQKFEDNKHTEAGKQSLLDRMTILAGLGVTWLRYLESYALSDVLVRKRKQSSEPDALQPDVEHETPLRKKKLKEKKSDLSGNDEIEHKKKKSKKNKSEE